MTGSIYR